MIIDGHIHVGKWNYKHYALLKVDIRGLDALLGACGIDQGLVMPTDKKDNAALLEEIKKYARKKYWFFPWIDPKKKGWLDFIAQNIKQIHGIKVHPSLDGIMGSVSNRLYRPVLEAAQKNGLPLLVHCGRWQEASSYKFPLEMAALYKDVNFILAHLGGDSEELKLAAPLAAKKLGLKNVFFDLSATREFWAIEKAAEVIGVDKLIFASDYPVMHPKVALENIRILNMPQAEKKLILGGNLARILEKRN
jgi:predicted TIM-barrel fold metal-dependent hydrolase